MVNEFTSVDASTELLGIHPWYISIYIYVYIYIYIYNIYNLNEPRLDVAVVISFWCISGSLLLLCKEIAGAPAGVAFSAVGTAIFDGVGKLLLKLRIPQEQEVGGIDQHIRGESFHSRMMQYHKAKSSDVSEST